MSMVKLTSRQIFGMKRATVEARIEKYYDETKDATVVIQYAFALLLRNALSVNDFSGMLEAVIHEILLRSNPNDTIRRLAPFFKNYFKSSDWERVIERVYKRKKDYLSVDEALHQYKKFLLEKTTPIDELENKQYKFISIFLKGDGKSHTWSLRDADPKISDKKWQAILELLTTLTVFEKNGTRLFVELVNSDLMNCTRRSLWEKKSATKKASSKENSTDHQWTDAVQLEQNENEQEIGISLPPDVDLKNLSPEELRRIVEEQLPEGATLTNLRLLQEEDSEQEALLDSVNQSLNQAVSIPAPTKEPTETKEKKTFRSLFPKKSQGRKTKNKKYLEEENKKSLMNTINGKKNRKRKKRK